MEEHFSDDQIAPVRKKQQVLKEQCDQLVENLRQGGKQAIEGSFHLMNFPALLQFSCRTCSWSRTITRTLHSRRRRVSST